MKGDTSFSFVRLSYEAEDADGRVGWRSDVSDVVTAWGTSVE